jgi:hypothetical protein
MRKPKITVNHVKVAISIVLILAGAFAIFYQGRRTLEYPLLGHHCMKTSKSIEVSYNLVRYGDPFSQYVDWHATPTNPRGRQGNIFRYESPLSAFALAALYLVADGSDFESRVDIGRYFTLFNLIGAYLLIGFFVLRRDVFSLLCFSFFIATSFFTISYSTKPQAETFSILYQALIMTVITYLLHADMRPFYKSLVIVVLAGLLCTGGKMNYFIIAFPMIAIYPFLDERTKGASNKFKYYALFIISGLAVSLALIFFTGFSFESTFVYFIKGNKPVLEDSLWKTFMEGFEGFSDVWERTREHFGSVVFGAGIYSVLYLSSKFVYIFIGKRMRSPTTYESFQQVLFLFIVGHCLNYIVLRNLYIPHRYYVVPLFMLFCLSFTVVLVDIRNLFYSDHKLKEIIQKGWDRIRASKPIDRFNTGRERADHFLSFFRISVFIYVLSYVSGYLGGELSSDEKFRSSWVHTLKYLRSTEPSFAIRRQVDELTSRLGDVSYVLFIVSLVFLLVNLVVFFIFSKNELLQKAFVSANQILKKMRITAAGSVLMGFLVAIGVLIVVQNGEMYFEEDNYQKDKIDLAEQLKKIRDDTKSGDLALCWKWCIAFYADKRSITDAKEVEIDYYVKNKLDSVLGPKRPLNVYYKRLRKYAPPATYWKLRSEDEIEKVKERRMQQGVFGIPIQSREEK